MREQEQIFGNGHLAPFQGSQALTSFSLFHTSFMAIIWMFENQHFHDAWIPFDRQNQLRLEFAYRHHDELARHFKDVSGKAVHVKPRPLRLKDVKEDEEDPSAYELIQYKHNCISIVLKDSHFHEPITLYPLMLLGSLSDRDILVTRMGGSLEC